MVIILTCTLTKETLTNAHSILRGSCSKHIHNIKAIILIRDLILYPIHGELGHKYRTSFHFDCFRMWPALKELVWMQILIRAQLKLQLYSRSEPRRTMSPGTGQLPRPKNKSLGSIYVVFNTLYLCSACVSFRVFIGSVPFWFAFTVHSCPRT